MSNPKLLITCEIKFMNKNNKLNLAACCNFSALFFQNGFEQFQEFAAENVYLAGGFTGGFFLGIAWS